MRWLPFLALVACNGGGSATDDTDPSGDADTDADSDADSDADADTDTVGDVVPTVLSADAWCFQHSTGEERWLWNLYVTAADPQGTSNLKTFGHEAKVSREGSVVATYQLVCEQDGDCTTTFNETEHGVLCAQATWYTFAIALEDADGNWSEPVEVTGRAGSGPEG